MRATSRPLFSSHGCTAGKHLFPPNGLLEWSPDNESSMPELALGIDTMAAIRRECLAYAMEHPECVSVRGDVISLIVFAGRQGRIRHLVGAYMWEE